MSGRRARLITLAAVLALAAAASIAFEIEGLVLAVLAVWLLHPHYREALSVVGQSENRLDGFATWCTRNIVIEDDPVVPEGVVPGTTAKVVAVTLFFGFAAVVFALVGYTAWELLGTILSALAGR